MEMTKVTDDELIQELESRGYITDLLWCRQDVILNLKRINQDRQQKFPDLDLDEQDEILDEDIINVIYGYQAAGI